MRAKKSLGQNFLMHQATAERIADAAHLTSKSVVLEIGPGTGKLTHALLSRARKVVAVETDAALIPVLQETFAPEIKEGRLELVHGDIRDFTLLSSIGLNKVKSYEVVANIPYYITGEILRSFLSREHQPLALTLLVQKEVAERIARAKKESLLSLSVKAYGTPKYEFTVPRGAFVPSPKVDSAVLSVSSVSRRAFRTKDEENAFFRLIHAGFAHKRKQLLGNLRSIASEKALRAAFREEKIPENTRAEDLPLSSWLALLRSLSTVHKPKKISQK